MSEPLDYVELQMAAEGVTLELESIEALRGQHFHSRTIIRNALTTIAKRAFEQAARPQYGGSVLYVGRPPAMPLTDACAALDAPAHETKEKP